MLIINLGIYLIRGSDFCWSILCCGGSALLGCLRLSGSLWRLRGSLRCLWRLRGNLCCLRRLRGSLCCLLKCSCGNLSFFLSEFSFRYWRFSCWYKCLTNYRFCFLFLLLQLFIFSQILDSLLLNSGFLFFYFSSINPGNKLIPCSNNPFFWFFNCLFYILYLLIHDFLIFSFDFFRLSCSFCFSFL